MKLVDVRPVVDCVTVVLRLNHKMYGSRKAQTSSWFVSSRESMVLGPQTQYGQPASLIQEYVLPAQNLEKDQARLGDGNDFFYFDALYFCLGCLTRHEARNDYFSIKILQIFQYIG